MSTRDERIERMQTVNDLVSPALREEMTQQAKLAASNMFLLFGDKAVLSATGFVHAVMSAHEAALLWLLSEGYVELTDKGAATEDEVSTRRARKQLAVGEQDAEPAEKVARYL